MNKLFISFLLIFLSPFFLYAQNADLMDIDSSDLDSLFNEEKYHDETDNTTNKNSILGDMRKRGIEFNASYYFSGAVNPGWDMYPWEFNGNEKFSWALGIEMGSSLSINAQISETFRVISVFTYQIPGFSFALGDFFFDYNILDKVFIRAGKYEQSWGISPNFTFTNLLSRVSIPIDENFPPAAGQSYTAKFDIPIGIGGLQLISLTRYNIAEEKKAPPKEYFGFGGKFNLAFTWADFNLGMYYQEYMATRGFLSIKTVVFNFDIYNEWLLAYNNHTDNSIKFAFNFGISKSFFDNKLEINAEYFFNGEETTYYYRPEIEFRESDTPPFLEGNNFALNLIYRFKGQINPRIFARLLYGDESYSLITGLRISPLSNIEIYFAVPMVFGNKESYYYKNSFNVLDQHRPFSFVLYVSFSGGVRAGYYY